MNYTSVDNKKPIVRFFTQQKQILIFITKILIAAGLLYYLVSSIDYAQIIPAIEDANLWLIGAVLVLSFVNIFLQYFKWKLTSNNILDENSRSKILTSLFYGFSAGIITPLRIGEYFGRAIAFRNKTVLQVSLATLIDKSFPLMIVASIGSVSSVFFVYSYYNVSIYITIALFVVLFSLFYFFALLVLNPKFWDGFLFSKVKKIERMNSLIESFQTLKALDRKYFLKMSLISFLFYSCFLFQYAILVSAFSHHFDFLTFLWIANLIMFVKTVIPPVSLGELGIREGASVYFLTTVGETTSVAFNASIFLFLINLLIPSLVGLVLLMKRNNA